MAPTPEQARLIARLKSDEEAHPLPIHNEAGGLAGYLTPVTHRLAQSTTVQEALFRWRKAHLTSFLTVFTPSVEKTKAFLLNYSLPDPARILFLVSELDSRAIGNIGLCNIEPVSAELDNVIRGEAPKCAGLMPGAQRALLDWAFSALKVPLVYLNVLADNARAVRAYRNVGFVEVARTPLTRQPFEEGYRLVPASAATGDAELARMEISSANFYRNFRIAI